nr:winged helix-turn-helix domain-containing protein [Actinomycetota bacterium]
VLAGRAHEHPAAALVAPLESLRRAFVDAPAGRGDDVLRRVSSALSALEASDPLGQAPYLMVTMALVLGEQGHADAALEWWRRAEEAGERGGVAPFLAGTSRGYRALLHAQAGRLGEAELELAGAEPLPRAGWRAYHVDVARAAVAGARGDAAAALASAERAARVAIRAPIAFRYWTGADLAAVLAQVGQWAAAHETLTATMAAVDEKLPGAAGAYLRARLHALRAWLRSGEGDVAGADEDLRGFWALAGDAAAHVVRREWPRLEALLWGALERGALEPEEAVRTIATAWPDGAPLIAFTEHPVGAVRRAALSPAVASGHPRALHGLRRLVEDPDPSVAARAHAAAAGLAVVAPPLIVNLLGGFVVRRGPWIVDGEAWERPMAARLVRFLAVHRDAVVPDDLLFEAFWPDSSLAAARRGLQVAVSRARAVLDPPGADTSVIEAADRAYRLRLEQAIVDVDEFERMADAALGEQGRPRRALLERARALWGGEPLPEDRYAEWSVAWRERLVDRYIDVLGALAEVAAAEGDHSVAIQTAREVVDLDPVNEGAHRELMAAYARAGRRGHALRQYLECRRALIDELGVEPSDATSRLQARILAGEPVRAPGAAGPG